MLKIITRFKTLFFLLVISTQVLFCQKTGSVLSWPRITQENKPWTRWWWPGSIVDKQNLSVALEDYSKAGLGGVELTVIYGVKGEEKKFIPYLSPAWMKIFAYTLKEADRLDLGVDMANSSSWPFGGPWVTDDDAARYIAYKKWTLEEGETLEQSVTYIQEPYIRFNGTVRKDISGLIDPVVKNDNLQALAIDQVRFQKAIPLQKLMAYSDKGQITDLTNNVDDNGRLIWKAPQGHWTLYGLFEGWHGKMVERAGPGGEGYVIDHFSGRAVSHYLDHFSDAFTGYDISKLRGFFNDSYEVDDATGQSDWTNDFLDEFRSRRGYDLCDYLPALFQKDIPGKNARILSDYRQTISDLILDRFTLQWTDWAHSQGKITRNQAHGSPGNILDLYGASDIPETEGTDIIRLKLAISAANVNGKRYVSAETGTWLGEHFSSTLSELKNAVDQCFIAGVNHIFFHGTCYSPANEPWPGFLFYASAEINPANTIWTDLPVLNNYIARVQSFTQSTKPFNDILMYYPVFDIYPVYKNRMLEHFDSPHRDFDSTLFKTGAHEMLLKGYCFDYISDHQLTGSITANGKIRTLGGSSYRALILPGCRFIPLSTFEKVIKMAAEGATIIVYGDLPEDIAGWANLDSNRTRFQSILKQIVFRNSGDISIMEAKIGAGRIIKGRDLANLLEFAGIAAENMVETGLQFNRRLTDNGHCYFIINKTQRSYNGWIPLSVHDRSVIIFNPMDGTSGMAEARISSSGNLDVYARLMPQESIILKTINSGLTERRIEYFDQAGTTKEVSGNWMVNFITGGPALPGPINTEKLESWTKFNLPGVKDFSGTAQYSISFKRPAKKADAWQLDLGKVCESARVYLNGLEIAVLIGPVYQVIIKDSQLDSENRLVIRVTNLAANRISYLDRNGIQWKRFYNVNYPAHLQENSMNGLFDASHWGPRESGLIGPVTITPLVRHRIISD